jgi:pimeloyl-ACP methyl ester carboxylesterase
MQTHAVTRLSILFFGLICAALTAQAQQPTQSPAPRPAYVLPDDVASRKVDVYSEGARMTGYVYVLKATRADKKLPTIIMAHGWGGTQSGLRRDAAEFAQEGYLVLTFDYRGWGESDSRVTLVKPAEDPKQVTFTASVRAIREVVDPLDMAADWQNAIHWVHGEPQVDTARIGLWGSSMGGSYVVYAAAHDPRVKAVHSQVTGGLKGSLWTARPPTFTEATQRARGEIGYPEPSAQVYPGLRGAPISSRFANYNPLDDITDVNSVAFQFVLSEHEQYLNNEEHAIAAYKRYQGPKNLVVIPGINHYDIYGKAREQTHKLAREWFDKYLKNAT